MIAGTSFVWDGAALQPDGVISALDRGVLFGDGIYETIRGYNGVLFQLEAHLDRMAQGLRVLQMPVEPTIAQVREALAQLEPLDQGQDLRLRVTVTRGVGGQPWELYQTTGPSIALQCRVLPRLCDILPKVGCSATISDVRRNETSPLSRIKSLNCLDNLLARSQAQAAGFDDVLFLNTADRVVEASTSNLFIVAGKAIFTPPVEEGLLPGITREVVMELAHVTQRPLIAEDLFQADEIFLTNSISEIVPLTHLDGNPIGTGDPGPVTASLYATYRKMTQGT